MKHLTFPPLAEFRDRSGIIRSIYGCTLVGRFELIDRQSQIKAILDNATDEQTWQDLYLNKPEFTRAVDRILELNGIDPDWLTPEMLEAMVFARCEDGEWKSGWLTELNQRESKPTTGETIESTLPNLLALVSLHCDSLHEAIELANTIPANTLLDTMDARTEMLKTPEQRAEDEKKANMAKLKTEFSELMK